MVVIGHGARNHSPAGESTAMHYISLNFIADALMFLPSIFGLTI